MSQETSLEKEVERLSAEAGMSPREYLDYCQASMQNFTQSIPDLIKSLRGDKNQIQAKNKKLHQKISMGARRTYGSF